MPSATILSAARTRAASEVLNLDESAAGTKGRGEASVASAKSPADLEAAKKAFQDALMGQSASSGHGVLGILAAAFADLQAWWNEWHTEWKPICDELHAAFETWEWKSCCHALSKFDDSAHAIPSKMKGMMSDGDATALSDALRLVQKQVAQ